MRSQCLSVFLLVLAASGCANPAPKAPSIVEINSMLESTDPQVQLEATQWVVQLGPKAADTVPALTAALKSPNMTVRQNAAMALGHIGAEAPGVVSALTAALEDGEFSVQSAAATSLGKLGPNASSAIPALERFSAQSKEGDRKSSSCDPGADAVKKIRP